MPSWMIAFGLGILMTGYAPEAPDVRWLPPLLVLPLLSLRFPRLRLAGAFSLGLWWALLEAGQALADRLPSELEQSDIWVEGRVTGLPRRGESSQRFTFEVARWCPRAGLRGCEFSEPAVLRRRLLLNHYGEEAFAPAQRWRLKVRLKRPHGFVNPGGFDYEAWLLQQGFSATGYVREDRGNALLHDGRGEGGFDALRHAFRERLAAVFAGEDAPLRQQGLIRALTIGDRHGIGKAQWELFSATGTNHLMVISGLHLGLLAMLGYLACAWGARLFPRLLLWLPAPRLGALGALSAAWVYAGLAGFSLPVQRAFVMVSALMLGRLLNRQTSARHSLCLALGVVLALDPLAPHNTGFWLSFGAVAVLLHLAARAPQEGPASWPTRAMLALKAQFGICLGLLPLMLVFFQQTSLLAPLVNLAAIPLVGLLVVPLCLSGMALLWVAPVLARPALLAADRLLDWLMLCLESIAARLPYAVLELPALPPWALALLAAGVLGLLSAAPWKLRLAALAGVLLPLLLAGPERLPHGAFRLHVLDVGQGLAAVVETAQHRLVYDTGPAFSPRFDAGSGVVLPFLRARNLARVDIVIVSHGDLDHAGGLPAVWRRFPRARYLGGEAGIFPPGAAAGACRTGQRWRWDGVDFAILHPDRRYANSNDASCVLRIAAGGHVALLPGDIEAAAERRLLADDPGALRAGILVAPHHGSRTSSTPGFVRAAEARWVVYSSGYLNRFGHPIETVRQRYARAGAAALNTADSGTVSFLVTAEGGIEAPETWRKVRRRWWSSP